MAAKSKKLKLNLVLHAPEPLALEAREALEQSLTKLLYQLIADLSPLQTAIPVIQVAQPANYPFMLQAEVGGAWIARCSTVTEKAAVDAAMELRRLDPKIKLRIRHSLGGPKLTTTLPVWDQAVSLDEQPYRTALWYEPEPPLAVGDRTFVPGAGSRRVKGYVVEKGVLRIVLERDPVFDAGGDFAGASTPRPAVTPPLSPAFPRNLKAAGRPAWTPAPPPTTTKAKGGTTRKLPRPGKN